MRERLIMLAKEAEQEAELQARFSKLAKQAEEMPPMPQAETDMIEKDDWVGLRLLSLMLSTDVSNINIKDVTRSLKYYEYKYSPDIVAAAFAILTIERADKGEWYNPKSRSLREMELMLAEVGKDLGWKEDTNELTMWIKGKL